MRDGIHMGPLKAEVYWGAEWQNWEANPPDIAVVVDVLTFSTVIDVALAARLKCFVPPVDASSSVYPGALWTGRREAGGISLSPDSMSGLPTGCEVAFQSPNGGACVRSMLGQVLTVAIGCMRNAGAMADWIGTRERARVALVACGERWPNRSMRPALEDWLGVGAIAVCLPLSSLSVNACAARVAYLDAENRLDEVLYETRSGQELLERGYPADIKWTQAIDALRAVPIVTRGGAIINGGS